MLAVIILAKDVINRERVENKTAILYKEIAKVDVAVKLHARARLDVLLQAAVDPDVRRSLQTASAKPDSQAQVRDKLLPVLRKINFELKEYKADLLMALDNRGFVVAQTGDREQSSGYSMGGFPVVEAALRGYVRDDILILDKDVFLVAARPVIQEGRYVGAVVHAMKVSDKLATEISPALQFALFSGNMMIAVGTPKIEGQVNADSSTIAGPLDTVLASKQYQDRGYSDVQQIKTDQGEFMAVYAKVRGEAAVRNVGYAVVASLALMTSPKEVYERAGKQDIDALPLVWLIVGFVVLTLIGWLFTYIEGQRPVMRMLHAVDDMTRSDPKDQLNVYRFRRKMRKIAQAINKVIDYKMRSVLEDGDAGSAKSKSIDSILGTQEESRLSSASFKFIEPSAEDVPPPPPGPEPVDKKAAVKKAPPAPAAPPAPKRPPTPPTGAVKPPTSSQPAVGSSSEGSKEELAYFQEIYEQFAALKKQLNEPLDQLTFEKFQVTLAKNRDTLKARYGCSAVKFQVYEKDGKASLKATPVKD
jgi:hypothetical protein